MEFSDEEIREELSRLGYNSVPSDKLAEFKRDLLTLINSDKSKNSSLNSSIEDPPVDTQINRAYNDLAAKNVSNHGSHWIDQEIKEDYRFQPRDNQVSEFLEDWDYRGVNRSNSRKDGDILSTEGRPKTAPNKSCYNAPGFFEYEKSQIPDNLDDSGASGRVKRKTCRKMASGVKRIDESFTDSDFGDAFNAYERLKINHACEQRKPQLPKEAKSNSLDKKPSWIRTSIPPHDRRPKQLNSHQLLKKYNKSWEANPAPGEKLRDDVCNAVKAKLMKNFEVKKPMRVYVPNTYRRPHEIPRTALRWSVRSAIESYEMPEHGVYHAVDSF